MKNNTRFFSTWELMRFDGVGSTRQIVNLATFEHPLRVLSDKLVTTEQRWSLLWYTEINESVSELEFKKIQEKLENDNWYLFNN